jgi:hypothetical protein
MRARSAARASCRSGLDHPTAPAGLTTGSRSRTRRHRRCDARRKRIGAANATTGDCRSRWALPRRPESRRRRAQPPRRRVPPVLRVVLAAGRSDPPGPFGTSPSPGIFADCFPQQIVFQHELPFAGNECSTAKTACCFKIDGLGPRFGSDDLVQSIAVRAAEKRRCIRVRHERSQPAKRSWRPS